MTDWKTLDTRDTAFNRIAHHRQEDNVELGLLPEVINDAFGYTSEWS